MKTPLLTGLLAASALAVVPAFAATMSATTPAPAAAKIATTPAPAATKMAAASTPAATTMAATPAPAVKKPVAKPAPVMNIAMLQIKQSSKFGKYLTDGNGRALYVFSADKRASDDVKAKSACTAACAIAWPPATIKNMPKSARGIDKSDLATIARADGTKQLTFEGRPLYLFSRDKNGAAPVGQGIQHFGGTWHLVTPAGALDQKGIG